MGTRPHSRFGPEFLAVVAATVWPVTAESLARLQTLAGGPLDWDHFLAVTHRQRVAGLVSASLRQLPADVVPGAALAALAKEAEDLARKDLLFLFETQRLLTGLRHAGVEAAVLKGGPLGVLAYGSAGIRHSKDVDLLVDASRVPEAEDTLTRLGYTRKVPPEAWPEVEVAEFRALRSHFEFVRPQNGAQVELHWRLSENAEFGVQFPPPVTWRSVELGGGLSVPMLPHADLLEYLCVHGASHAWSRLKWLADVATLLRADGELPAKLLRQAAQHGTERAVAQALVLCRRFYGLPLPPGFACTLPVRMLCRMAEDALSTGGAAGEIAESRGRNAEVHLSHLLLSSRLRYLAAELRAELLMPPAWNEVSPTPGRKMLHRLRSLWKRLVQS